MAEGQTSPRRTTRKKRKVDYYAIEHPKLPRAERVSHAKDRLFPIEITDTDISDGIVHHIHYVGYSHRWDEWRKHDEIEDLSLASGSTKRKSNANPTETGLLSLELARKIKSSLNGSRKDDPNVCIEIPCSQEWFNK